ncbi:hypothetical protein QVD17_34950 [Tagetes erecta]|uniref:SAM domain-containing protein n=1 Tax=Tagetes erecta TaxID=13708 RepID=A0AAD8NKR0_TARER|nr:hypothetical protein QVD17_34950 [Tagetes erecta]
MSEVQPPPLEAPVNGDPADTVAGPTKRQRRPSVRLGEIGDQQHTYDNHRRTKPQQWRYNSKATKTRHLMNLSGSHNYQTLDNHLDCSWKTKRGFSVSTKRVRSNWGTKLNDDEEDDDYDDADRYSDYDRDCDGDGDSQLKDQSLNNGVRVRVRVSDDVELDDPSDTDGKNCWNDNDDTSLERNGVRVWLNQLGLSRYFSIFEVHEVDDEVLPLLTLEDLKDMGINAVGSRRKMFCSIQKLGKGFS